MDENKIRRIVQQEIARSNSGSRFKINSIPNHSHNGVDSLQIKEENVIPSTSITGFVSFAQATTYTINLNASFTPKQLQVNGIATGEYSGGQTRVMLVGSAQFTPTFYLQADTDTVVNTGTLQFPFNGKPAQSGSFLSVTRGGTSNFYAGVTEDHIVSVNFPTTNTIQARATVTNFSKTSITIDVPVLTSGWEITLNFVIT
jgi:hypothetical protein